MAQLSDRPNDTKAQFKRCGTCSQTFGFLMDREFGHEEELESHERALSRLAGGIANLGYQCGMLWGSTMGVGAEAYRREKDPDQAIGLALAASKVVLQSFEKRTMTVDCRDVTGRNLNTFWGMAGMLFHVLRKGMNNSDCFVLAEDWTPEAFQAAHEGLDAGPHLERTPRSCAAEVVRRMGGTEQEAVLAAGFGGGMGLSGNACGALGAAVWMKGLEWAREHPGKSPEPWTDTGDKVTLAVFEDRTDGEFLCSKICGRTFETVDEHSAYVDEGGCAELIEALAGS